MTDPGGLMKTAKENCAASELLLREGYSKIAVSRAYYAMFYAAEAILLTRGLSFSAHSAVVAAFGREFAKTGILDAKFHRYLIDAQDARNLSDYGAEAQVSLDKANQVIRWATEFIDAVEEFLTSGHTR